MAKSNLFDLNFVYSDSEGEFKGFDPENSSIMMLSLMGIWLYLNQGMSE